MTCNSVAGDCSRSMNERQQLEPSGDESVHPGEGTASKARRGTEWRANGVWFILLSSQLVVSSFPHRAGLRWDVVCGIRGEASKEWRVVEVVEVVEVSYSILFYPILKRIEWSSHWGRRGTRCRASAGWGGRAGARQRVQDVPKYTRQGNGEGLPPIAQYRTEPTNGVRKYFTGGDGEFKTLLALIRRNDGLSL